MQVGILTKLLRAGPACACCGPLPPAGPHPLQVLPTSPPLWFSVISRCAPAQPQPTAQLQSSGGPSWRWQLVQLPGASGADPAWSPAPPLGQREARQIPKAGGSGGLSSPAGGVLVHPPLSPQGSKHVDIRALSLFLLLRARLVGGGGGGDPPSSARAAQKSGREDPDSQSRSRTHERRGKPRTRDGSPGARLPGGRRGEDGGGEDAALGRHLAGARPRSRAAACAFSSFSHKISDLLVINSTVTSLRACFPQTFCLCRLLHGKGRSCASGHAARSV